MLTLKEIAIKYKSLGIIKSAYFLLDVQSTLDLLSDLTKMGVRVVGCDCWRYIDPEIKDPTQLLEIVGGGVGVDHPYENPIELNAQIIKEFLEQSFPKDAQLVSLSIDDPKIPNKFSSIFENIH